MSWTQESRKDAKSFIEKDLAQHGFKVREIIFDTFGTADIAQVTLEGEIYTFANAHNIGGAYRELNDYLHEHTIMAPETTDYVVLDTGNNIQNESYLLILFTPGCG